MVDSAHRGPRVHPPRPPDSTGQGPCSYPDTGLPDFTQSSPFIIQVEGATPLFTAGRFRVTDNLGDASNTVSYP